jgi:parallel beta-helix repeat protein
MQSNPQEVIVKKVLSFTLIGLWMVIGSAFATEIGPGSVSGDWYALGNPYNINGDISVDSSTTLNIHEGVEVFFQGFYTLTVNGTLRAIGTESDSVLFTAADRWGNIHFRYSTTGNIFSYCIVQHGDGVVIGWGSAATINHSTFRWNNSDYAGGGIALWEASNLTLESCLITENTSEQTAGGILVAEDSYLNMNNCTISNNSTAYRGGGIDFWMARGDISNCLFSGNETLLSGNGGGGLACTSPESEVTVSNCTFTGNSAVTSGGGALCILGSSVSFFNCSFIGNHAVGYSGGGVYLNSPGNVILDHCLIANNTAELSGGGVRVYTANYPLIKNCTIVNNTARGGLGGGINIYSSTPEIVNTIIEGNAGNGGLYFDSSPSPDITYCDIANNLPENLMGSVPASLGVITGVNTNGDSCDVFMNICEDPLFEDPANGNYHLTWANYPTNDSTRSPCIDAGDPASPLDPDSTIADIGCYYFDQGTSWVDDHPKLQQLSEFLLYPNYPNPFNASTVLRYSLPQPSEVTLTIHNILGQRVATMFSGTQQAGNHTITWDAYDISSGVYFVRLQNSQHIKSQKVHLVK